MGEGHRTLIWESQQQQTTVEAAEVEGWGGEPPAAPRAQEGSVSVVNATGPSWGVRSGCFRACRTREGPAPIEKGAVCNCLQVPLITDASRVEIERASAEVPKPGYI